MTHAIVQAPLYQDYLDRARVLKSAVTAPAAVELLQNVFRAYVKLGEIVQNVGHPLRDFTADLGGRMAIGISAGNAVIVWTDTRLGSEAIFLSIVPNTESAPPNVCTVGRKTCRAGRPQR